MSSLSTKLHHGEVRSVNTFSELVSRAKFFLSLLRIYLIMLKNAFFPIPGKKFLNNKMSDILKEFSNFTHLEIAETVYCSIETWFQVNITILEFASKIRKSGCEKRPDCMVTTMFICWWWEWTRISLENSSNNGDPLLALMRLVN